LLVQKVAQKNTVPTVAGRLPEKIKKPIRFLKPYRLMAPLPKSPGGP